FLGRKAQEGIGERGSCGSPRRGRKPSRCYLGRPGHDRLRNLKRLSSPASAGSWRHATATDSFRERGGQPALAGVLAKRQGTPLCCRTDWNYFWQRGGR